MGERQPASGGELAPLFVDCRLLEERGQASNDENDVADAAERHHHGVKPPYLARTHEDQNATTPACMR
jgi:hypothetical protein